MFLNFQMSEEHTTVDKELNEVGSAASALQETQKAIKNEILEQTKVSSLINS